jgi:carbon monoxide dehydrogenase subunit G
MKLSEEFRIAQQPASVWTFFEQPTLVARCLPGVESISVIDDDNFQIRATQSIGPMNATFDAKVTVLERIPNELIRFRATGRSVRGAVGNIRTENAVHLKPDGDGTTVVVHGEVILAGALGSVGQKVVAKQAGKVTAQFAGNLERALSGETPLLAADSPDSSPPRSELPALAAIHTVDRRSTAGSDDRWSKVAAAMSAVSAVLSLIAILRQPRRA